MDSKSIPARLQKVECANSTVSLPSPDLADRQTNTEKHYSLGFASSSSASPSPPRSTTSTQQPHKQTGAHFSALFAFLTLSNLPLLLLAITGSIVVGLTSPCLSYLLGRIFNHFSAFSKDEVSRNEFSDQIRNTCRLIAFLGIVTWTAGGVEFGAWTAFGETQGHKARKDLFTTLTRRKTISWVERQAGLSASVSTNIANLHRATSFPLGLVVRLIVDGVGSLVLALVVSWKLTLVTIAPIPLTFLSLGFFSSRVRSRLQAHSEAAAEASSWVAAVIRAMETVKVCVAEEETVSRYRNLLASAASKWVNATVWNAAQAGITRMLALSMFIAGFAYGGVLARKGEVSSGDVVTAFYSAYSAAKMAMMVVPQMMVLDQGRVAGASLAEIKKPNQDDEEPEKGSVPSRCNGRIEFRNVSFAYPARPQVLNNFSLIIRPGEFAFVTGPSGCGKSTLGQLLVSFYSDYSGQILLDGADVRHLDRQWLRRSVCYVAQDGEMFPGTISDNIRLAGEAMSDEPTEISRIDILAAAEFGQLANSNVANLSSGLATDVGSDGKALSGGQRQRVALARARIRNSDVLILDEPTAGLDPATAANVMRGLRRWRKNKTTIVITHDDWTEKVDTTDRMSRSRGRKPRERSRLDDRKRFTTDGSDLRDAFSHFDDFSGRPVSQLSFGPLPWLRPLGEDIEDSKTPDGLDEKMPDRDGQPASFKPLSLWTILKTVWPSLGRRSRFRLLSAGAAAAVFAVCAPLFGFAFTRLLETFYLPPESRVSRGSAVGTVLGVVLIDGISTFIFQAGFQTVGHRWVEAVRLAALTQVLARGVEHLRRRDDSSETDVDDNDDISDTLDRHADCMQHLVGRLVGYIAIAAVMALVAAIWSLATSWQVALIAAAAMPIVYGAIVVFDRVLAILDRRCSGAVSSVASHLTTVIARIRTVRALTAEGRLGRDHDHLIAAALRRGVSKSVGASLVAGLPGASAIWFVGLISYASSVVAAPDPSRVSAVVLTINMLVVTVSNVALVVGQLPQTAGARDGASRVLALAVSGKDNDIGVELGRSAFDRLPRGAPVAKFANLNFAYPGMVSNTLQEVSLSIPAHQYTALVGPSGSGKSTVAALLAGLYLAPPPASSLWFLGSVPAQVASSRSIRSVFALVPQSASLLPLSLRENITLGMEEPPSDADLDQVFEEVGLTQFIATLPAGLETLVGGAGGASLSGGQAMRVAIARALIRKPKVIVLDEPTAALDPAAAKVVHETVGKLVSSRGNGRVGAVTVVVVTHSPDLMALADGVIVMEQGKVVQQGRFDDLRRVNGPLKALVG